MKNNSKLSNEKISNNFKKMIKDLKRHFIKKKKKKNTQLTIRKKNKIFSIPRHQRNSDSSHNEIFHLCIY